jgi:methylmalonyl-CoA/ethylmalonyl-CoA epimerase
VSINSWLRFIRKTVGFRNFIRMFLATVPRDADVAIWVSVSLRGVCGARSPKGRPGRTAGPAGRKVDGVFAIVASLRADGVEIISEPHVILRHSDDALGPAGTDEWMAFIQDSEGNTVGLVSHSATE